MKMDPSTRLRAVKVNARVGADGEADKVGGIVNSADVFLFISTCV